MKMFSWEIYHTWFINTLIISYRAGDVDGMCVASVFIEFPFTTLRVVLMQKGLSSHLERTSLHMQVIQILGSPMMIWSLTYSLHLRMTYLNILMMPLRHPLRVVMNILLVTRIFSMKISNHHCTHILMDTR
jgi:hypothetical protein